VTERPYHHGNLARALLDAAAEVIADVGAGQMSLREVARRAGVSNAAPVHHFGDKAGLFTALAAEGFGLLDERLADVRDRTGSFVEIGAAYVGFAVDHRPHFEVMFRPELYHADAPEVVEGSRAAARHLYELAGDHFGVDGDSRDAGVAAWSLVHGLATLLVNGNLGRRASDDPLGTARRIGALTSSRPDRGRSDPAVPSAPMPDGSGG
jgi:AcrR family transcriptional regulator